MAAVRRNYRRAGRVACEVELHLVGWADLHPQYRQLLLLRLVQKEQRKPTATAANRAATIQRGLLVRFRGATTAADEVICGPPSLICLS